MLKFNSIFADELNMFIDYKRGLGLKYEKEMFRLHKIDDILFDLKLENKEICQETYEALVQRDGMEEANYARQYGVTNDFCRFLISLDYHNIYFKEKKFHVINNYIPVLFDDNEINVIFETCDDFMIKSKGTKYFRLYYGYSILFRLLYSCGLRISEALKLKLNNISIERGVIQIINSKKNVSRYVVLSQSMSCCLVNYINIFCLDNNDFLFVNSRDSVLSAKSVRTFYKKVLKASSLNPNARVHDLRHVFCNNALNQMLSKGYDEYTVIVHLYKFMGHKSIHETEYYLHFTDYERNKIIEDRLELSKYLYEGVDLNE
ncbi:MAG: tyrosine-type recombinase/integrase [Erysipelotrichaceae bacterium]|nr:tyrosine-type recombinase/integrase [Erysipelotrichaceae bacterium]